MPDMSERVWGGKSNRGTLFASDELTKSDLVDVTEEIGTWTEQDAFLGEVG